MTDVFVSYARSSERQAQQLVGALQSLGYQAWRDDQLPAHRAYADVIQERLTSAKAVVVLWSEEAAQSQWVRAEADLARQAGTLVQASVDGTLPPIPFNQIQCADLENWSGETDGPGWAKLAQSVEALAGSKDEVSATSQKPSRAGKRSICVLPFANMSGDAEQEYFSDGISEDITTDLSNVSALAVTARNTAFTFKGKAVDVAGVARQLGVSHVLEGSVRKAGNRLRITAQLIDGATGDHVWAERFDRDLTDIFAIQDEISQAIVAALKLKLLPEEKKAIEQRGTTSAEAYNLYLMARQYWLTGNHGDRRREDRVVRLCQRAVEIDPGYAGAWALMALAQANLSLGFEDAGEDGRKAAERAIELDPTIAEAYCVRARHLLDREDLEGAQEAISVALRLGPESWEVNKEAARFYKAQRRIAEATPYFEKAVSLAETDFHAWALLVTCYQDQGDTDGVRRGAEMMFKQAERAIAEDPSNGAALGIGAGGLAILGQAQRAREWIERALLIDPDNLNMRFNFACVMANYLRDPDGSMDMLGSALSRCGKVMIRLTEVDPDFDSIRDHPRFQAMLAQAKERLAAAEQTARAARRN